MLQSENSVFVPLGGDIRQGAVRAREMAEQLRDDALYQLTRNPAGPDRAEALRQLQASADLIALASWAHVRLGQRPGILPA